MEEMTTYEKQEVANPFESTEAFQRLFDIGKMFASSQLVPKSYQGKPMDCVIAIDMANRMGLSPITVMQGLYVVQGMPSWSGQACMSIIKGSPRFKRVKVVQTGEKNTDTWGCYVEAFDQDTKEIVRGPEVTIKMAKDEGWYGKSGSKWKTMPELMLSYRASAFFARVHTPNSLMGYAVEGEPEDIQKPQVEATDPFKAAEVVV